MHVWIYWHDLDMTLYKSVLASLICIEIINKFCERSKLYHSHVLVLVQMPMTGSVSLLWSMLTVKRYSLVFTVFIHFSERSGTPLTVNQRCLHNTTGTWNESTHTVQHTIINRAFLWSTFPWLDYAGIVLRR